MYYFENITPTNGFDSKDLGNARQNNYAWSVTELEDFIYYGTGRNIPFNAVKSTNPSAITPELITPAVLDQRCEIWRHRIDDTGEWERVFKSPVNPGSVGFRSMLTYSPFGGNPCIIAAGYGRTSINMYKSPNGVDWFLINNGVTLPGTSSRDMVVINNVLYVCTINELLSEGVAYLYKSRDPEFFPWENVLDTTNPLYDPTKNPTGTISNMTVFNNRLYVGVSTRAGAQVWRSNGEEPELNEWTLIVDNGFGDAANINILSMGVFNNGLYVSGTKELPLSWALPMGFDMIRIDTRDRWRLIVGGIPFKPVDPSTGKRGRSASGYWSGFNNPFNVYAWQIVPHEDRLLVATFDDSSNMQVVLESILANKAAIIIQIGEEETEILIAIYQAVIRILNFIRYPYGFDLYESYDGIHFCPIFKNGAGNSSNYGGRTLFVDSRDELYIGTANPFQGCEVYKAREGGCHCNDAARPLTPPIPDDVDYPALFAQVHEEINEHFNMLQQKLPVVLRFLEDHGYHIWR